MKTEVLICFICLLLLGSGCRRSASTGANVATPGSITLSGSTAENGEARALIEKGKELYRSDQDADAAVAFREALKLDPESAEAHFRLGLAYEAMAKQEDAEAEFKKAIESYRKYLDKNPDDAEAHYEMGQTFAGLHQFSDAIREYRQAVKLKGDDADMYYDLGTAHTKLAQYDEAVTAFSKSLEIDGDNYRAQDALDEAREGVKRIQAGKKHQVDLLKKQKNDDSKKSGEGTPPATTGKPANVKQ